MHEISLVQGLFKQLADLAYENKMTRVVTVTMKIGPLSGVVIDSFRFGFEVLSAEDELVKGAKLVIETTPVTYRCTACNHEESYSSGKPDSCAKCGELLLIAEGGDDLVLQQVEME